MSNWYSPKITISGPEDGTACMGNLAFVKPQFKGEDQLTTIIRYDGAKT